MCSKKNWNILRRLTKHIILIPHHFISRRLKPATNIIISSSHHLIISSAFYFLLLFTFTSCDKSEILRGNWNLQSVFINDKEVTDSDEYHLILYYTYYYFFIQNSFNIKTVIDGQQWEAPNGFYIYNYRNKTIQMKFTLMDQRSEINAKIKKLTKNEMQLEYEKDGNIYLLTLFAR